MANKVNKVIDRNNNVLIDLTNDTITPNKVLSGVKFHGSDGKEYTGTLQPNELDTLKYTFIDYDGTVMYQFTDEEIDALEALPAGPDHTDDNLTFQQWNWTLEDLKAWDRTRTDRPIVGANLVTTDGKTYITLTTRPNSAEETFYFHKSSSSSQSPVIEIDWGDGSGIEQYTVDSSSGKVISHTFPALNTEYSISINAISNGENLCLGNTNYNKSGNYDGKYVSSIKLGNISGVYYCSKIDYSKVKKINIPNSISKLGFFEYSSMLECIVIPNGVTSIGTFYYCYGLRYISIINNISFLSSSTFQNCYSLSHITLPNTITSIPYSFLFKCYSIKDITIPDSVTTIDTNFFYNCSALSTVNIPYGLKTIGDYAFYDCYSLKNITIPNSVTKIGDYAFQDCSSLEVLKIPDSVTKIGGYVFSGCNSLTLDLSEQTKVITLTSSISLSTKYNRILVPSSLLDSYKSASYWSAYASIMVGI